MDEILSIRTEIEIRKGLEAQGLPRRSAISLSRRMTRLDGKQFGGMLPMQEARRLAEKLSSGAVSAKMLMSIAFIPLPLGWILAEIRFGQLHGLLHRPHKPGETLEIAEELQKRGSAITAEPTDLALVSRRDGTCELKVILNVTVRVFKNAGTNGSKMKSSNFGATVYLGADVINATVTSIDNEIGCFTHIVLKFAIHINQKKLNTKWEEGNTKVKNERTSATPPNQFEFANVPYEFVLMHEEGHVNETSTKMTGIAQRFLQCQDVDVATLQKQLQELWNKDVKAADDINSPTEERIRRKTWRRWDHRKP